MLETYMFMKLVLLLGGHRKIYFSVEQDFLTDVANEMWVVVTCYFWAEAVKMSGKILQPVSSQARVTKKTACSSWLSYNKVESLLTWITEGWLEKEITSPYSKHTKDKLHELEPLGSSPRHIFEQYNVSYPDQEWKVLEGLSIKVTWHILKSSYWLLCEQNIDDKRMNLGTLERINNNSSEER